MATEEQQQQVPLGEDAPILEVMSTMRAMRRLKPDPVPDELLERLVEAATWAPSGSNLQAYSYVVVTDREQIRRLTPLWHKTADFYLSATEGLVPDAVDAERVERMTRAVRFQRDHFEETPALIVPCYDTSGAQQELLGNWRQIASAMRSLEPADAAKLPVGMVRFASMGEAASVYPGVQNLLLAARALGLAATLTTWHLAFESDFKRVLGIPRRVKTFAVIPIGWPRGRFGPVKRRPATEAIHRNRW